MVDALSIAVARDAPEALHAATDALTECIVRFERRLVALNIGVSARIDINGHVVEIELLLLGILLGVILVTIHHDNGRWK
jgi:hypothetical protein